MNGINLRKIKESPIKLEDYTFGHIYCQLLNVKMYYILMLAKKQADVYHLPDIIRYILFYHLSQLKLFSIYL